MNHQFEEKYKTNATLALEKLDIFLTTKKAYLVNFKNLLPIILKQHQNLEKLQIIKQELKSLTSTYIYDDPEIIDIIPISDELKQDVEIFIKKQNKDYQFQHIIDMYEKTLQCKKTIENYESNQQQEMQLELYEYINQYENPKIRDLQFYFEIQKKIMQIFQSSQQKKVVNKIDRLQQLDRTFEFLQNKNKKFKLTTFDKPPEKYYEIVIYYDLNNLYWVEISQGRIQIFCKPNQRLIIINQLSNQRIDQAMIQQSIYELFTQQIDEKFIYDTIKRRLKEKATSKYVSNTKDNQPIIEQYDYFLLSKFI